MKLVALGEVSNIVTGSTPATSDPLNFGGRVPFVTPTDLGDSKPIEAAARSLTAQGAASSRLVPPGSVLICCIGSVGKIGIAGTELATNQQINAVIFDRTRVDSRYGFFACNKIAPQLLRMTSSTTVPIVSKSKLTEARIPLPPFDEQQRIAAILDKADELRAKRRQALAHLDTLTQSIFHSMFGNSDQSWPVLTVDALADQCHGAIRTGPFGSQLLTSEFTDAGIAVLGIDNAVSNGFSWKERRYISSEKYQQLKRYTVRPGDLLITIMGTLGRCAVVPADIPLAINTKHLCCITLDQSLAVPQWLHAYFLQSDEAQTYLRQTTKGAIMGGLNMGIIKKMPVRLPPLELQEIFATRVAAVECLKEIHRKHLAELDTLFASLQHRAFKGQL